MGANAQFIHSLVPTNDREAADYAHSLIADSLHESGHGGYSGTWAEANGVRLLPDTQPDAATAELFLVGGADPSTPLIDYWSAPVNAADRDAWKTSVAMGLCDEGLRSWTMLQRERRTPRVKHIEGRCQKWGPILFVKVATGGYAFGAICSS